MLDETRMFALVGLGGALGAMARYGVGRASFAVFGPNLPAGTLIVNVAGGFLMGVLAGWLAARDGAPALRAFLAVGVLGGFTTFSAFSLEFINLWRDRGAGPAALYAVLSVALSAAALLAGLAATRELP